MPDSLDPPRLARSRRARLLALATLATGLLAAGCGGSAGSPTTSASSVASSGSSGPGAAASGPLAFARCMRANGVPNFPDPNAGGGLFDLAGLNPSAPAFKAARAACRKLQPGGPPGPGAHTHPSAQTLAKLLKLAGCMRQHGVPQFPDPTTSVPPNFSPAEYSGLTDYDGAILAFPTTINFHSPAYTRAAAACGPLAQKIGLGHPH